MEVFIDNDGLVRVNGVYDRYLGAYVNDATVTAQFKTPAGTAVGSAFACSYVAASNGNYVGAFEEDHAFVLNRNYLLSVTVAGSSDRVGTKEFVVKALRRSG